MSVRIWMPVCALLFAIAASAVMADGDRHRQGHHDRGGYGGPRQERQYYPRHEPNYEGRGWRPDRHNYGVRQYAPIIEVGPRYSGGHDRPCPEQGGRQFQTQSQVTNVNVNVQVNGTQVQGAGGSGYAQQGRRCNMCGAVVPFGQHHCCWDDGECEHTARALAGYGR